MASDRLNIILISEMRVGSRWLHYLLADLLGKKVSPEIDRKALNDIAGVYHKVKDYFRDNRIVKFHHVTHEEILNRMPKIEEPYKIIGIVRNPRDRIVSLTFHQRYKPPNRGLDKIKQAPNDRAAVKVCFEHEDYQNDTERMFDMMEEEQSTMAWSKSSGDPYYIWTSYEWMLDNPRREIDKILYFLGVQKKDQEIKRALIKNSFKRKSGRVPGVENRKDEWRRKGINDDYLNWFSEEMLRDSELSYKRYFEILENEERIRQKDNFV